MNLFQVSLLATSKVVVSVLIGAFTCSAIPNTASTLRDFSYLIRTILLPCLTTANTAKSVNLEVLARCSVLLLFSTMLIVLGILSAFLMNMVLFPRKPMAKGIPKELIHDVRLDLLFDEVAADDDEVATPQAPLPPPPALLREGEDEEEEGGLQPNHSCSPPSSPSKAAAHPKIKKNSKEKTKTKTPYVAVILSDRLRAVGVTGSEIVASLDVPSVNLEQDANYAWGSYVACSTQNGVTLPISIMQNFADSLDWVDFAEGSAYIFIFSIMYMLYLWSAGPALVDRAQKASTKQRLIRELVLKHKKMSGLCDATTQTLSIPITAEEVVDTQRGVTTTPPPREGYSLDPLHDGDEHLHKNCMNSDEGVSGGSFASAGTQTNTTEVGVGGDDERAPPRHSAARTSSLKDSFTQTALTSPLDAAPVIPASSQTTPYNWERAAFIRTFYESDIKEMKRGGPSKMEKLAHASWGLVKQLMTNPPFVSILVGILIGAVPVIRGLFFDGGVLSMLMDATVLIGKGSVPSSLLMLGANLVGTASASSGHCGTEVEHNDEGENTEAPLTTQELRLLNEEGRYAAWVEADGDEAEKPGAARVVPDTGAYAELPLPLWTASPTSPAALHNTHHADVVPRALEEAEDIPVAQAKSSLIEDIKGALSFAGISKKFVWGVILVRLVLCPAVSFMILHTMIQTMPFLFGGREHMDRMVVVVLMVELASPTAINSVILFSSKGFFVYPWSKLLFFEYACSAISTVAWATIGLAYIQSL